MNKRLATRLLGPRFRSSWRWLSVFLCAGFICGAPSGLHACLWDYDTLKQERSRFPSTLELITGKFLRHSPEFYEWRIEDRDNRLKQDPRDLALYDDLGVAYQKTGHYDKAIKLMETKEEIKPGVYETYSNWGTFLILSGEFERGLEYIDKALAINPDAHFGREKYQKWLVEYALAQRRDGKVAFPLRALTADGLVPDGGFAKFLLTKLNAPKLSTKEAQAATKGVLGMMRFANHDNPLLLEALGDLLSDNRTEMNAKQLAVRCYLKASYVVKDESAREAYRELAQHAIWMQVREGSDRDQLKLEELERQFKQELADADKWYAKLQGQERDWIAQGKNADQEFDKLYQAEPQALQIKQPKARRKVVVKDGLFLGTAMLASVGLGMWVWRKLTKGPSIVPPQEKQIDEGTPGQKTT